MRKLKLQVQMTVDGFVGAGDGGMQWARRDWDDALKQYVGALSEPVDCIVLGRKLAQGFIPYWAANPKQEGAEIFNNAHKVVFTRTLEKSEWENTELARGGLVQEIGRLKNQPGGDMIAYGGAAFVADLIAHDLLDEYHLFINPAAIGTGLNIFGQVQGLHRLELVAATPFACGIVVLQYRPGRG